MTESSHMFVYLKNIRHEGNKAVMRKVADKIELITSIAKTLNIGTQSSILGTFTLTHRMLPVKSLTLGSTFPGLPRKASLCLKPAFCSISVKVVCLTGARASSARAFDARASGGDQIVMLSVLGGLRIASGVLTFSAPRNGEASS